jgi:hypothetical protein
MSDYIFENIDSMTILGNKFSLNTVKWSSIGGVRKGYKIVSKIDQGVAVIDKDPLPQDNFVIGTIINTFSNTTYSSSEFGLKVPDYVFPIKYTKHFEDSKLLSYYLTVIKEKYLNEVNDSIERFSKIRDAGKIDYTLLINTLRTLGFDVDMTLGNNEFKEDVYRRLLQEAVNYYKISGTKYTLDFLGYVQSSFLDFEVLYTQDYNFFTSSPPEGNTNFYLTSRINIIYDIIKYSSREDIIKLKDIFYKIAPVNIMINYFLGSVSGSVDLRFLVKQNPVKTEVSNDLISEGRLIYDNENTIMYDNGDFMESEFLRHFKSANGKYLILNSGERIVPGN